MKNIYWLLCFFIVPLMNGFAQHTSRVSFNQEWKFKIDSVQSYHPSDVDDKDWRTLDLPHDWSIEGKFDKNNPSGVGGGALPGGIGWYRKYFSVPVSEKNKSYFIQFDGVYMNSEVFINGKSLGVRPNGYISFQYDLTPYLNFGTQSNVIAVKVDNSKQPNSRWYSGSGIYRNVWMIKLNSDHIAHNGTFIQVNDISESKATVHIDTELSGTSEEKGLELITTLFDPTGKIVGKAQHPVNGLKQKQVIQVDRPQLWSVEKPNLYRAVSHLKRNGRLLDTYQTNFGIRYFNFDAENGFTLNGKNVKILGVCLHHDLGALGAAINTRAIERQLEILKSMGCNGIRTSHNPPAPELLELADRMGFIVMDEMFDMWARPKSKYDFSLAWDQWHKKDLEDFIRRDRNHASVFIWSVGNEIPEQWGEKGDSSGIMISKELAAITRSLDTTRPVVTANNEISSHNQLIQSGAFDMIGYNYNHTKWADFKHDYPGKKLVITESTSALQTRGHYDLVPFDTIRRWPVRWDLLFTGGNPGNTVSAYDHVSTPWGSTHEESVKELLKNDHVSGMYIWTGFDYLGEPTPYVWPSRSSYFGIIDLAGFPKDVYYMYQSVFTNKNVLHIYPHWNWKKGDTVEVVAYYNNADNVELMVNGISAGKKSKSKEDLHVKWRVPYQPGYIEAISRKNGNVVLKKKVSTASVASRIILKADRSAINADGKDLSFITATIVDEHGTTVPDADDLIKFSVSDAGKIVGVDSGSPTSLEPFKSDKHTALNGLALCIVRSTGKKGNITIKAEAPGLASHTIIVKAQ